MNLCWKKNFPEAACDNVIGRSGSVALCDFHGTYSPVAPDTVAYLAVSDSSAHGMAERGYLAISDSCAHDTERG